MSEWYISRGGEQEGPMTAQQVQALLASGELKANESLAWKDGMADWKTIFDSGVLAEASLSGYGPAQEAMPHPSAVKNPAGPPAHGSSIRIDPKPVLNPYSAPATNVATSNDFGGPVEYPGFGRMAYVGLQIGITILAYGFLFVAIRGTAGSGGMEAMLGGFFVVMGLAGIAGIYIGVKRVQNLGMSGWAILWSMVPIMSIWIAWRMFACPAGYHDHKQLDSTGKVLTGILIALVVLGLAANVLVAFTTDSSF